MSDDARQMRNVCRQMASVDADVAGKMRSEYRRLAMSQTGYGLGMTFLAILEGACLSACPPEQVPWLRIVCMVGFIFLAAFSYFSAAKAWYHGNQAHDAFMKTRDLLLRFAATDEPGCP